MASDRSPELRFALAAILFSGVEPLSNFGRRSPKEHFCEIILKSGYWPRRYRFIYLFFFFFPSNFSFGSYSFQ